jgi:hypothetical protein
MSILMKQCLSNPPGICPAKALNAKTFFGVHCFDSMKHEFVAISIVSLILVAYTLCAAFGIFLGLVMLTVSVSPLLVIWMVWVVLKHGTFEGRELLENEEYGYADRQ